MLVAKDSRALMVKGQPQISICRAVFLMASSSGTVRRREEIEEEARYALECQKESKKQLNYLYTRTSSFFAECRYSEPVSIDTVAIRVSIVGWKASVDWSKLTFSGSRPRRQEKTHL
jgi:hypothetical protein